MSQSGGQEGDEKTVSDMGGKYLDTGANASAEEADEGTEDTDRKVIDIIESFRLQETFYDKKSLKQYLNGKSREEKEEKKGGVRLVYHLWFTPRASSSPLPFPT